MSDRQAPIVLPEPSASPAGFPLEDGGLRLRAAGPGDAERLCGWWNDGSVMAHAGFPDGLGTTPAAVAAGLARDSDETGRRLILEEDGVPIGEMNYRFPAPGTAEIGIKICTPARREHGLGSRALRLLIDWLFRVREADRVILDTNLMNSRAQHVYEKIGFERLGVRIDAWRDQHGVLQSSVDYAMTREAWREHKCP
ncbi:MAG: GNAT family N-acetyltransferase [Clostridia bacterium]|nr:GNAT family N-acetyltransferase [Clostridia bacterium]